MSDVTSVTVSKSTVGNKKLEPDSDGYYTVIFGAYNVLSTKGEVHLADGIEEVLTDKTNILNRRLIPGRLRAEAEHPKYIPGMTDEQYILRNLEIDATRVAGHIKEVKVIKTSKSSGILGVGNVVLVQGKIKPSGIYGKGLKDSLDNPDEDTCFSVRSFTDDIIVNGRTTKKCKQIVTWDWVNEPGISYASKLNGLTLESMDLASVSVNKLLNIKSDLETTLLTVESEDVISSIDDLLENTKPKDILGMWC